jgi:hypothetical protein
MPSPAALVADGTLTWNAATRSNGYMWGSDCQSENAALSVRRLRHLPRLAQMTSPSWLSYLERFHQKTDPKRCMDGSQIVSEPKSFAGEYLGCKLTLHGNWLTWAGFTRCPWTVTTEKSFTGSLHTEKK